MRTLRRIARGVEEEREDGRAGACLDEERIMSERLRSPFVFLRGERKSPPFPRFHTRADVRRAISFRVLQVLLFIFTLNGSAPGFFSVHDPGGTALSR